MAEIEGVLRGHRLEKFAVYGLSTETERFLLEYGNKISVLGLLDGFRETGEIYGYPIIPLMSAIDEGISVIVVVARPGSCKVIAKRIGGTCTENGIRLFDVRGNDLLAPKAEAYDFGNMDGESKSVLLERIAQAEVVSFDLFDTLVMRKVPGSLEVFEILEKNLAEQKVFIPDFARLRLAAEKECSRGKAPSLEEIYEKVLELAGGSFLTASELAQMEWELDRSLLVPRRFVCEIYKDAVKKGKRVVVTTDSYYSREQIQQILSKEGLGGYESVLVSCCVGTSKMHGLFEHLLDLNQRHPEGILHIGDDETADMDSAKKHGIDTYRIYSGMDMLDMLGGLGLEKETDSLSDKVKIGLLVSRLLNDPFVFGNDNHRFSVRDSFDVGYLFCGSLITDFTIWIRDRVRREGISQVLFCARDGFLIGKLFRMIERDVSSFYFLTSRIAAVRAGVLNAEDIAYVDSMVFFGSDEEKLYTRYGMKADDIQDSVGRKEAILSRSEKLRENYKKYISKLGIEDKPSAMFDFVAKGTAQMYLQKLFPQHIKGFYFLRLEPEFMADKELEIEPFYSDREKDQSEIFDNYYILELLLTSPYPATEEFDEEGTPVYAKETRSGQDIQCLKNAQKGIIAYFKDYIGILPETEWRTNKRLDEAILSLINRIKIEDEDFMSLKVEDPFFGRTTDVKDILGCLY